MLVKVTRTLRENISTEIRQTGDTGTFSLGYIETRYLTPPAMCTQVHYPSWRDGDNNPLVNAIVLCAPEWSTRAFKNSYEGQTADRMTVTRNGSLTTSKKGGCPDTSCILFSEISGRNLKVAFRKRFYRILRSTCTHKETGFNTQLTRHS